MAKEAPLVSVILPTYNERGNIVDLIRSLDEHLSRDSLGYELLVVDDNSPDGTAQLVQEEFGGRPDLTLMVRREERGLASAIKQGILAATGEIAVVMDTDFNHNPALLPQMVRLLEYYDLVIGSRFAIGGGMEDDLRYKMSFLYNLFVRITLRSQIQDNLSGFFAMRREQLLGFPLDSIFRGYGEYFLRLLYEARRSGYSILEIPVFYQLRRHGQSKSRTLSMLRDYTLAVLQVKLQDWKTGKYRSQQRSL